MAINPTAIWRVRPSGNNLNGGGYDPGISGAATDYSQQNSAQASGSAGTASGTTTFTDAVSASFTAAMVGNAIFIASGTGFTAGFYFVTAYTSASTVTLDRSPGTGTAAGWKLGGGWADFWTNTTANIVPGNTCYILGSGTPNPVSYTYDYLLNSAWVPVSGNDTAGRIFFLNDPATPGYKAPPDTTGGMPCIQIGSSGGISGATFNVMNGLWWVLASVVPQGTRVFQNDMAEIGSVHDQFGVDCNFLGFTSFIELGSEFFSSVSGSGGSYGVCALRGGSIMIGCNVHDTIGGGIEIVFDNSFVIQSCIIAKCGSYGIYYQANFGVISNNTIDGNAGDGIELHDGNASLSTVNIMNNIISNHVNGGTYGLTVDSGTTAENDLVKGLVDYNVFYNNSQDVNAISYGAHDTHGGSNPYVGQSTENYTLA